MEDWKQMGLDLGKVLSDELNSVIAAKEQAFLTVIGADVVFSAVIAVLAGIMQGELKQLEEVHSKEMADILRRDIIEMLQGDIDR